ncbi:MAG: N-acetyltransferase family protein [Chloroflexota bacterium]
MTAAPQARAIQSDYEIRRATTADVHALVDADRGEVADADELWQRRLRRHVVATLGAKNCYVADAEGVGLSFMQYLFFEEDNGMVQAMFPGMYPELAAHEAMVEFLDVAPEARRSGLLVRGMNMVTDEARRRGAKSVISFIRPDNKGAIFVCQSSGFRVYSVRHSRYRFFRQAITIEPRPAHLSEVPLGLLVRRLS